MCSDRIHNDIDLHNDRGQCGQEQRKEQLPKITVLLENSLKLNLGSGVALDYELVADNHDPERQK